MVDRVDKIRFPEVRRVNPSDDALEDRNRRGQGQEAAEEDEDGFNLISDRTDWQILFDQPHLWQQGLELMVDEIRALSFLGVNLKTDPSLLKVRAELLDGSIYQEAYLSVPRSFGMQIKILPRFSPIPLGKLTAGKSIWLTVPKDVAAVREEITRVTRVEKSFSRTFKRYLSHKSWLQRLAIQDPVSRRYNSEIIGIYTILFVIFGLFVFGLFYLME